MALMLLLAPAALLLPRAAVPPRAQQHRSSARFLLCAQPQPDLEPNVAEALKAEFRLRAARGNRGLSLRPDEVKGLQDLAERLESINPTPAPTASPLLLGEWTLDFTDAADVLSLGILPGSFAEIGRIVQAVAVGGEDGDTASFRVDNMIQILPRGSAILGGAFAAAATSRYSVQAICRVLTAARVSLTFIGGSLTPSAQVDRHKTLFSCH